MSSNDAELPSVAVFSPQSKAPKQDYLNELRSYLCKNEQLQPFVHAIKDLSHTWSIFANSRGDVAALSQGPRYTQALSDWIATGESAPISNVMSGILSLPLLTIIQVTQYFQFLELRNVRHHEFMAHLRSRGGVQGYCGGLMPAIAIACSADESELVVNASKAMRIALGVGAYGELGDDENETGPTTMVIRLKQEGQGEEIIKKFPGAYISAITDPKTISVVGPSHILAKVQSYVGDLGMITQAMHLRGKVHNPENASLAKQLCTVCDQYDVLHLPNASHITVPLRSNKTGEVFQNELLTHEAVDTILASQCQWYKLLQGLSQDLLRTGLQSHSIAGFGIGDCVPLSPFHQAGLHITKIDMLSLIKHNMPATLPTQSSLEYKYPPNAVAVVGMACRLPGANNVEELWDIMSRGESRAEELPFERLDILNSFRASQDMKWAGKQKFYGNFIDGIDCFDNAFFGTSPREAVSMDPQQRILLETAYQAMESSGYLRSHRRESGDPVGVFIGASFVEYLDNTSANPPTAYTSTGTIRAFLCGKISYHFGWSGPSEVLDTACSSSLVAINRACKAIQTGECPMALTGGVNLISGIHNYLDLTKAGFLSQTGQCKPFDSAADGYCRSEGAGLVVLKRLDQAMADGNQIIGVIPGTATNQGGLSSSITIPHSPAQVKLYQSILHQAGMTPDQVSYVEAHGTGTQAGDPLEIASIREVFGSSTRNIAVHVGSVKGNIGHCETAAGVAGLIKTLLMVNKGYIPPLANHKQLNPKIPSLSPDNIAIASKLEPWEAPLRSALVNSYGAAGSNSAMLVCERPPKRTEASTKLLRQTFSYPIILGATSKEHLVENAKCLEKYLTVAASKIDIADLAFTLAERRKQHRFSWISIESSLDGLIHSLKDISNNVFEAPQEPKKVVLAFSGQSRQTIGLDRNVYESCTLLRSYIDHCDHLLKRLGFSAILPGIFATEPITDTVVLQCGMFALQYASAKAWIASGLQVDAVIGHSFGELTALAVSDVLSLEDALKIIGTRASLMQSNWGSDRGTMLAIHGTAEQVREIITSIPAGDRDVEIACYNSLTSQVVVGTDSSIAVLEKVLKGNPKFNHLSCQRLDVSHGFHSRFTEGLLGDLNEVADSVTFNRPNVPLETCTPQQLDQINSHRISQHTREPVYFHHAVRRIEQRLGSCVWLEAGTDSPIIPMVKKAVESPEKHSFQSVKARGGEHPMSPISAVTSTLWREGILVSYWNFSPQQADLDQIWLPPYQFKRTPHWMPYTDHAIEAMKSQPTVEKSETQPETPSRLVSARQVEGEFSINVSTKRYVNIVSGHAVMARPLCPAAMYMECAVMAAQILVGKIEDQALWFESLVFEAPLGIDPSRDALIALKRDEGAQAWSFVAKSSVMGDPKSRLTSHAKGKFGFIKKPQFQRYQRLVTNRMSELASTPNTETLKSKRAYGLFSRIVHYSPMLKGISVITLADCEAVAKIEVPTQLETSESTVVRFCDTVALDTFIQVVGLLINSSDRCGADEAFLATGVDSFSMSLDCDFERCKSWSVYAMFAPLGEGKATGDVFILNQEGTLVTTIMGVQFTRMPIARLEKLLESANKQMPTDITTKKESSRPAVIDATPDSSPDLTPDDSAESTPWEDSSQTSDGDSKNADDGNVVGGLKTLIAGYVGLSENDIIDDANLGDLGLDSLAVIELADEIESGYDKKIDGDDLIMMNFGQLCQAFGLQGKPNTQAKAPPIAATKDLSTTGSQPQNTNVTVEISQEKEVTHLADPIETLAQCETMFDASAERCGFSNYWTNVAPQQDELLLAYVAEAFRTAGVNLWKIQSGDAVPGFQYLPKHSQLMGRLWDILERLKIVTRNGSQILRSGKSIPDTPSSVVLERFNKSFPKYANEGRLMAVTSPYLAECMTGKADPVALLFGNSNAQECLNDFYNNSPQLATLTDVTLSFVAKLLASNDRKDPIKILEIGAGFGGTTTRLAKILQDLGRPIEYTFTDISSVLVKNASKKFSQYAWMNFQTLNLEKDPPVALQGKYDFLIATNVVHATSSTVNSTSRMRSLLKQDGFIVLSEVTRIVDWYDLVYGPLDGWWSFKDHRTYPLQSAEAWIADLKAAGFASASYSKGSNEESLTQQLIIGSTRERKVPSTTSIPTNPMLRQSCRIETTAYKIVDDTRILADIYCPMNSSKQAMPIALMIHGGGYMTLSKNAIRPYQTQTLLESGILPISLDYRLCPEINLIDGPMSDVRDALSWARSDLPTIARQFGFNVDTQRIAVIGWSSGGHLAMSTAWTSLEASLKPPQVILSFYGPTDFESSGIDARRAEEYPERTMSMEKIRKALPTKPITSYDSEGTDTSGLGWVKPGDPRSELVLGLFKEGNGLNLMLNGIKDDNWRRSPSKHLVEAISPLAQLRKGCYDVPTFLVHGDRDEIVPFEQARTFWEALEAEGVDCGLARVPRAKHIHDLMLKAGTEAWETGGVGPAYRFLLERLGK